MTWYEHPAVWVSAFLFCGRAVQALVNYFIARLALQHKQPLVISPLGVRLGTVAVKQEGLLARWWRRDKPDQRSDPVPDGDADSTAPGAQTS